MEHIRVHEYHGIIPPNASVVPKIMCRIRADPEAVPIFPLRHITTLDRLATGNLNFALTPTSYLVLKSAPRLQSCFKRSYWLCRCCCYSNSATV
jgi:hypothetical protein